MKPFKGFEAFFDAQKNALYIGNGIHWYLFEETPIRVLTVFAEDLDKDRLSQKGLDLMNVHDPIARLKKHITCKFGGTDTRADISTSGHSFPDSPECLHSDRCPAFSLCCKLTLVANGTLTATETIIVRLIAKGLADKQIAFYRHTSEHTIHTQRRQIEYKMGVGSKPEIVREAYRLGIATL